MGSFPSWVKGGNNRQTETCIGTDHQQATRSKGVTGEGDVNYTWEGLAPDANSKIQGMDVVTILERLTRQHGYPKRIKVDNGPEFISKDVNRWRYWNHVELDFSRPGTPSDNTVVEAFNSRLRQECLNEHWFLSLEDARL